MKIARPDEEWARNHLWDNGIGTHNWIIFPRGDPLWECYCCPLARQPVVSVEAILEHIATDTHQESMTMYKLAGKEIV